MVLGGILGGVAGGAGINIIIRAIDKFTKPMKKVEKGLKKQQTFLSKLTKFYKAHQIAISAAVGAVVAFGISAVKTAIDSERAFTQFNLALGDTADIMLTDLKKASRGMVSDLDLVNSANRALALGIRKNQLPELMAVATARAKIFGRTTTEAFDDITIGIGRQSRMILDNLGIIIDLDRAYTEYAESIGKTKDALTEMEKKQALTNKILEDSFWLVRANSLMIETHSEQLQRWTASVKDLTRESGGLLLNLNDFLVLLQALQFGISPITEDFLPAFMRKTNKTSIEITKLSENIKEANEELRGLKSNLLGVMEVRFLGEAKKNVEIAEKEAEINRLELDLLDAQGREEEKLRKQLEEKRNELERLRLEREVEFTDIKKIALAKNEAFIAEKESTEVNLKAFLESNEEKKRGWDEERQKVIDLQKEIENLTKAYYRAASARGEARFPAPIGITGRRSIIGVGDAIITKKGDIVKTHPQDNIIATRGGVGGTTIIIEGDNFGVDGEMIADALQEKLNEKVNT